MEKAFSVSSKMEKVDLNLSYISPVKQFDQEQSSFFAKKDNVTMQIRHKALPISCGSKPQIVEVMKLKSNLEAESLARRNCQTALGIACDMLQEILSTGEINSRKIESFLADHDNRKRKAEEAFEAQQERKMKMNDMAFHDSFDSISSNEVARKRKHVEEAQLDDIMKIISPPCKKVKDKEDELDALDEVIKKDQLAFHNLTVKWSEVDECISGRLQQVEEKKFYSKELKNRLSDSMTTEKLKALAVGTVDYLDKIFSGEVKSERHEQFFSKIGSVAQALMYTCTNEAFSEDQTDLVYNIVDEHFKNRKGIKENYVQWVLLSEALLDIYCKFFSISDRSLALELIQASPVDGCDTETLSGLLA